MRRESMVVVGVGVVTGVLAALLAGPREFLNWAVIGATVVAIALSVRPDLLGRLGAVGRPEDR